jgi:K+-sensing histidine kinase KdpD
MSQRYALENAHKQPYGAERERLFALDNACKWAHHQVRVTIQGQSGLDVVVEDDDPGCPSAVLRQLAERGVRIDESTPGYGLGLAIVKDIVEQYSADISFGRSRQLSGFEICVTLANAGKDYCRAHNHAVALKLYLETHRLHQEKYPC